MNPWWHPPAAAHKPETLYFAERDREWIRRKWETIRDAHMTADQCNNKWRKLSDEVNDYMDRKGLTDPVQRVKVKGENLELADLFANGKWWRQEAQAHTDDLNLFLRLKEMGLL